MWFRLCIGLVIGGCAPVTAASSLPGQLGPPGLLAVSPLASGERFVLEAHGLDAGAVVRWVRGSALGAGPCPAALGGDCLGLRDPVLLGAAQVGADGVARWQGRVPGGVPVGGRLVAQVVELGVGVRTAAQAFEVGADPLRVYSDGFDDSGSLASWSVLSEVEGTAPLHELIDLDQSVPGALVLDPNDHDDPSLPDGGTGPAWFEDRKGPLVYRELEGDFAVRVEVEIGTRDDLSVAPVGSYLAGGLLVRAPSSAPGGVRGQEAWLMYNLGMQAGFVATEVKTTWPDSDGDGGSESTLFLDPAASLRGELIVCRRGAAFRFWRRLPGEAGWREEQPSGATLIFNGAWLPGVDFLAEGFVRPDLPERVQVGVMANRYVDGGGSPVRVVARRFDVWTPRSWAACALPPLD